MTESTVARAATILGDSWSLLILQRGFLGVRRFNEWRAELGISESVLSGRLRDLTAAGLLTAAPYREGGRERKEYRLTPCSLDLWSVYVSAWSWERVHLPRPAMPELMHDACGASTDAELLCGACGAAIGPRDTVPTLVPGTQLAGVTPRRHPRRTRGPLPADPLSGFPGTVELLGDRWSTAVVVSAMLGVRTFSGIQELLSVSPDVLSDRLRRFVHVGVLAAVPDGYRLTDSGRATFPILVNVLAWSERWLRPQGYSTPMRVHHRACGAEVDPVLACTVCHRRLERAAVRFTRPDPVPRP